MDTAVPTAPPTPIAIETAVPISPTPLPIDTPVPQIYVVLAGDNLTSIAETFGTSIDAIQQANELDDGNTIFVGQELEIPAAAAGTTDNVATQPSGSTASEEVGETPKGRAVLPNRILCPAVEEIDQEDGTIIGHSAVCRIPIVSYQIGEGETPLVLVGGIHGGYEWNTILLAYSFLDYLRQYPKAVPPALTIYLIPNANPDGLYAVTRRVGRFTASDVDEIAVPGRFNGNYVDLNRNWDCDWTPNATWRDNPISGGPAPFSEPENQVLRDYILAKDPGATVFLHSAATGVFASGCGQIDLASKSLAEVYSKASGYPLYDGFHYYDVTGDAGDWLASQGIPSISIELTDHESLNWNMNRAGFEALMNYIAAGSD